MCYLDNKIKEVIKILDSLEDDGDMIYDDIFCRSKFIEFAECIQITDKDTMVSFSIDGVQLYQNQKSDTWTAGWKIENYSPDLQFKEKK